MKRIIIFTALLTTSIVIHAAKALDIALEIPSIQVEFYDASQTGQIRVNNCNQCAQSLYTFDKNVKIFKSDKPVSIKKLLEDQWSTEYPTIFLNPSDNRVIQIVY